MHVVILSAGFGTRLYPLTKKFPKALLPIAKKPVIEYILEKLEGFSIKAITIVTNEIYYPRFMEWLSSYIPAYPLSIISDATYSQADKLGAVGDLQFAIRKENIKDDILLFVSDMIFSFSLRNFIKAALAEKKKNRILFFKLKDIKEASKYGVALLDNSGKVIKFQEKPERPFSDLAAFGVYYLPKEKLNLIDVFLKEVEKKDVLGCYFQWLSKVDKLYGNVQKGGLWIDIGDKEQYRKAEIIVKKNRRLLCQR